MIDLLIIKVGWVDPPPGLRPMQVSYQGSGPVNSHLEGQNLG